MLHWILMSGTMNVKRRRDLTLVQPIPPQQLSHQPLTPRQSLLLPNPGRRSSSLNLHPHLQTRLALPNQPSNSIPLVKSGEKRRKEGRNLVSVSTVVETISWMNVQSIPTMVINLQHPQANLQNREKLE